MLSRALCVLEQTMCVSWSCFTFAVRPTEVQTRLLDGLGCNIIYLGNGIAYVFIDMPRRRYRKGSRPTVEERTKHNMRTFLEVDMQVLQTVCVRFRIHAPGIGASNGGFTVFIVQGASPWGLLIARNATGSGSSTTPPTRL